MYEPVTFHLEKHNILIDNQHGFTCVPHNRVLSKLYNFGIKGSLLGWFRSFLKRDDNESELITQCQNVTMLECQKLHPVYLRAQF